MLITTKYFSVSCIDHCHTKECEFLTLCMIAIYLLFIYSTNRFSDVRRWEVYQNDGVSEGPWSFHRLVLQAIVTI